MANASKTSGFFHTIKERLFHGEKHVDSDYELVYGRFATLQEACIKLKQNSNNYISSIYSLCLNTNNVSIDFATLLEDAARPNEYQTLAQQFRSSHNRLNSEKQQLIVNELNEKVIKPLDGALATYSNLQARITQRNQLHTELEYYLNKVHELNNDRDERTRKGKTESQSQVDKFDRNQTKLNDARAKYTDFATTLMADLTNAWESRIAILGPAMASFVQAEKLFLQIYATELNEVNRAESLTTAPASVVPQPLSGADVLPPRVAGDVQYMPSASPLSAAAPHVASTTGTTLAQAPSTASTTSMTSATDFKVSPPPTMAPIKPYTSHDMTEQPRQQMPPMAQHDQEAIARADGEGMLQQTHSLTDQERQQHEQLVAASASSIPATAQAAVAGGDDALKTHGVTTATCVNTATASGPAPTPMLAAPYAGNDASGNPFDDASGATFPPMAGADTGYSSVTHATVGVPPSTGTATTMPVDSGLNVPGGHMSSQMPAPTAPVYASMTEGAPALNDRFATAGIISPKAAGEHEAKRQYEQEQKSHVTV